MIDYRVLITLAQFLILVLTFTVLLDSWRLNRKIRINGKKLMDKAEKHLKEAQQHNQDCFELLNKVKNNSGDRNAIQ